MAGGVPPRARLPLLLLGALALVTGVALGLLRVGWPVPPAIAPAAGLHGALMVCGFFGCVISLERAVALDRTWAYAAPLLAGTGTLVALPWPAQTAMVATLYAAAGTVLLAASAVVVRRQPALFTVTLALGAAAWTGGSLLWRAGQPFETVVPWWLAFLVLTIAGERLELARFVPRPPAAQRHFRGVLVLLLLGLAGSAWPFGQLLFGAALLALALWLLQHDLARRTVRTKGLTRYIAVCLLAGYVWLAVAGAIVLRSGGLAPGGPAWDAALHAVALGFVFSMVFGHAPIVLPSVMRVALPYHPAFYGPLVALHGALLLRLAGDAAGDFGWLRWGALLSALALAAFVALTLGSVLRGRARTRAPRRAA